LGIVGQAGPESPASALPDEAAPPAMLLEPLTERQAEILALLASGHSNREIASRLYVAEGTVKAHVHQIYGKLMARNRLEAVTHARRLGLLTS
ncbi:MAG: helix-turn-helix domain-containing protein, partial [Thermomicrobiales bacterium]